MARAYHRYWTVKYPDGMISALGFMSLWPREARKKAEKQFNKPWKALKNEGFECIQVIVKEVKS